MASPVVPGWARTHWKAVLVGLLVLTAGVVLGWSLKPRPAPQYRNVIVRDTALAQEVPHVKPTLGERITKATVKPAQVATSEGTPAVAIVKQFCVASAPAAETPIHRDAGAVQRLPPSAPVPILPPFSGRFADNQLELQAVRSDGSLYDATFPAHPPLEWVVGHGGDSDTAAIVRENRALFRLLPHLGKCAKGGILGSAIGAGAGLLAGLDVGKAAAIGAGAGCAGSQF